MFVERIFLLFSASLRRLPLIILLLIAMTATPFASAERLRLVTEEWPSLIDNTDASPEGILWEISRDVLTSLGYEVTLEFVPWKRALRMVLAGERDGIVGIGFTEERAAQLRYPKEALLLSETVVVSRKSRYVVYTGPESLTGLQVGISPGYSYYGAIRDAKNFERVAMPGIDSGLQMLMLGRIDAMLSNHYVVMAEAKRLGVSEDIFVSDVPISSGPVYLAFSLDVPEAFVIEFSKALERYKQANLITELPSSGL